MKSRFCRRCLLASLVAVGVVLIGHGSVEAAKTLRWKLKQGDKFQVLLTQKQKTKQSGALAGQGDVSNDMVIHMSWLVQKVDDDGLIHLQQTIDRVTMTMQIPGMGEQKYDSASTEEPQGIAQTLSGMLKPMIGAKFVQMMDDRGEIRDIQIEKGALDGLAGNLMMKEFFSEDGMKGMMAQGAAVLPAQAIEKGHAWNHVFETKTPMGQMKIDARYVYDGEEERKGKTLDKLAVKLAISFADDAGMMGAKIKIADQDCTGAMYFDAEAGRFVETEVTQKMTMQVSFGNTQIDQKVESTMLMTITPVK